jgi:hypothetical protein
MLGGKPAGGMLGGKPNNGGRPANQLNPFAGGGRNQPKIIVVPSSQGGYPPQQGGYPPQQGGYPPQQGGYGPPRQGYAPQGPSAPWRGS